ncbi:MAG: rhomboid family intramembrane serine protease, partial [Ktedonobacterales bacterium]
MEQVTDARGLADHGEELLLQGKVAEAGAEFSRAAQLDPRLAEAHLGLAEVNLALGAYGVVNIACRHVLELAPESADGAVARAILDVLDRRYDAATSELERAETLDPGRPYVHALRGYALRQLGQNGDASLAEAKSARLSGNRELAQLFPKVAAAPVVAPSPFAAAQAAPSAPAQPPMPRSWDQRSGLERRMVRLRFLTSNTAIVTKALIAINVAVYLLGAVLSQNLLQPAQDSNPLYQFGIQQGTLIAQDPTQVYRLFTAMFLHQNFWHIASNMVVLYFIGPILETLLGRMRFLLVYIVGGLA